MLYQNVKDLMLCTAEIIEISKNGRLNILNKKAFQEDLINNLVYNVVFNQEQDVVDSICWIIWEAANIFGINPSSIQGLYEAKGRKEYEKITVPAINIRGLTYDVAKALLRAASKNNAKAFIFEIARSEMQYTHQKPFEYTSVILGAAIYEKYTGPIFIQGDHFQIIARKYREDKKKEINFVKFLIEESIEAGFYNIDIDTSTLVDLSKNAIKEQQQLNFEMAAMLTRSIRENEPDGITISIGGEIGEVGGKNSTEEELRAYLEGYKENIPENMKGISKISIQTGTTHGGVPLPDGTIAKVKLDFDTLRRLSRLAINEYGLAGAVQHGASTLPSDAFNHFPETDTAEVHLATEFQNMIYDSEIFPEKLRNDIYECLKSHYASEWKEGETEEQFIYKTRKKGFGPFKERLWNLPLDIRNEICEKLEDKFDFLFKKLNATNTSNLVEQNIKLVYVDKEIPYPLISEIN